MRVELSKKRCALVIVTVFMLCGYVQKAIAYNAPASDATGGLNGVEMAKKVAEEGMVLLKNNVPANGKVKALPLANNESIALFGISQLDFIYGGGGSGNFASEYYVGLYEGLQKKEQAGRLSLYDKLYDAYKQYYQDCWKKDISYAYGTRQGAILLRRGELPLTKEQVKAASQNADTAIINIGRPAGEDADRSNRQGDFLLNDTELDLIDNVKMAGFNKIIVILNVTGVMDTSWFVDDDAIDAVLLVYLPGMVGGNAMADVLCGDAYPSGKLVDTWAKSYNDYPSSKNFGNSLHTKYEEDIFVGYRYFETIPGAAEKVNYEFGYGLSYADLIIGNVSSKVSGEGRNRMVNVSATVTNYSRKYSGKEVVQLYYSAPELKLTQPARELAAFVKTRELKPGESQTVTLSFPFDDMASYDDVKKTGHEAAYVLESGKYRFFLGNSVRNTKEIGTYSLNDLEIVEQLKHRMVPNTEHLTRRLTSSGYYEPLKQTVAAVKTPEFEEAKYANPPRSDDPFITFKEVVEYVNAHPADNELDILTTFVSRLSDEDAVKLTGCTMPIRGMGHRTGLAGLSSYGVPIIGTSNGPAGIQYNGSKNTYETTSTFFPCATMQASTWNVELVQQLGAAMGAEARHFGMSLWQAPGMNLHRDPLCGRNFEYFAEDPVITGKMGVAITFGVQSQKFASQIKHFAFNNQEKGRWGNDSQISERAIREIYLKGYEITVKESHPWSVMSSYNRINGTQTSGSFELLTEVLRNEWGFDGFVMTDFRTANVSHAEEIIAGNDVKAPADSPRPNQVLAALKNGSLKRWQVNRSAERLLRFVLKTQDAQDIASQPFQYHITLSVDRDVVTVDGNEVILLDEVTWGEFQQSIDGRFGQTYSLLDADGKSVTEGGTPLKIGMKLQVTAEDGVTTGIYTFSKASIALNKPAKASYVEPGDFAAARAVDGDKNTRWSGFEGNYVWGHWIEIDLGEAYHITQIDSSFYRGAEREFFYEIWTRAKDGNDWGDVVKGRDFAAAGYEKALTGTSEKVATQSDKLQHTARYVAVKVTGGQNAYGPTINELEIYGWRLESNEYKIDEAAQTISVQRGDTTTDAVAKLKLIGNATIEFGGNDTWLNTGEKITVTDVNGMKTEYTIRER